MASIPVASRLIELAETDVRYAIPKSELDSILSASPFVHVSGTFNTRDIGQLPGSPIRPGYIFRSGSLESLDETGKRQLTNQLGIKKIFDLRADHERERYPEPNIPGVENVWLPNSYSNTINIGDFVSGGGEEGYCKMYMDIMEVYASTFKSVLEHVRAQPGKPFLFHCARELITY
ncbi:tyrosine phosphatase [Colletotrichum karsti]|uniref:Tyrosine phosphatase n=1 Tax=Colletotrichum karsti TaxID=1095194 RepID=A0A9P6IC32_9PEZI|nr:tyrosine phosphatase [Colletotrichum karsti]KAF9880868.1 tyrosine phosphatase [Colletotrichum karsti]